MCRKASTGDMVDLPAWMQVCAMKGTSGHYRSIIIQKCVMSNTLYDDADVPLTAPILKMIINRAWTRKDGNMNRPSLRHDMDGMPPFTMLDLSKDEVAMLNNEDDLITSQYLDPRDPGDRGGKDPQETKGGQPKQLAYQAKSGSRGPTKGSRKSNVHKDYQLLQEGCVWCGAQWISDLCPKLLVWILFFQIEMHQETYHRELFTGMTCPGTSGEPLERPQENKCRSVNRKIIQIYIP